jgi:hypothetical protein
MTSDKRKVARDWLFYLGCFVFGAVSGAFIFPGQEITVFIIIRDTAVAIVVGMVLLLLLGKLIGRVQFSLSSSFWCSAIGHVNFTWIIVFFVGYLFANHMAIALLIAVAIQWAFQTILFQIAVRAKGGTLQRWRAAILSGLVILCDFLVASPLIEFWEYLRQRC